MNRHFLAYMIIFACFCFTISECYAWPPPPVISSDWKVYAPVGTTASVDAWVVSGGAVDDWDWDWPYGFYDVGQDDDPYDSTSWGKHNTAGKYTVDVEATNVSGSDEASTYVYIFDVEIQDNPPNRDTPEYICYGTGTNIYYKIEPTSGWSPDWVKLYIKDGETIVRTQTLSNSVGEQTVNWNGKDSEDQWVEPKEYTAEIEVRKSEKNCSDTHSITVVKVDLDISGVADADELDPGGYVGLNGDREIISLSIEPDSLSIGTVKLDITSGTSKIEVWDALTGGNKVIPDGQNYYKTWTVGSQPGSLYVEGINASDSLRDVELRLSFTKDAATCDDKVKFTVVEVDLKAYKRDGSTQVSADNEEDPGAYVAYNNDDDDADGGGTTADKDDTDGVSGEDDLIKVYFGFNAPFDTLQTGKVVIERADTKIKLWKQQTKGSGQEITFTANKKTYDLSDAGDRTDFANDIKNKYLWVEGYSPSIALKDTELKLTYTDLDDQKIHADLVKLTVFETELKTYKRDDSELKMHKEVDPGNYIVYNNDDDNGNDTKDVSDSPVNGEDDLQKVHFKFGTIFNGLQTGKVVIERSNGKLKLWKETSKTSEIVFTANKKTYDLSNSTDRTNFANDIKNKDLYIEGADKSSGMRDSEFTLKFTDPDEKDICVDPVKYTIFKIDLDVNADGDTDDAVDEIVGYMPGYEGSTPEITYAGVTYTSGQQMKIITEPVDGTRVTGVTYTITSCSDEPGFCMNSGATPGTDDNDYSFKAASEDTEEAGTIAGGKASVDFYCKDFGGYCDVKITLKKATDTVFEITRGIPSDTKNGNNCADHWPGDVGPGAGSGAADDTDDTPAGDGVNGDELSRYQEYRGFIISGTHTRTLPTKKDVFIRNVDVPNGGASGHMNEATLGAPVHVVLAAEYDTTNRQINFRQETAHLGMQTVIEVYNAVCRGWGATSCSAEPWVPNRLTYCRVDAAKIAGNGASLTSAITSSTNPIPVNNNNDYWRPSISAVFDWGAFRIENETITYTGTAGGNSFTGCTRGAMGSTAAAHANGSDVTNFADSADVVKQVLAHEAGHVIGLEDDYASPPPPPYPNWPAHIMNGWINPGAYSGHGYTATTYGPSVPGEFRVKP